MKPQLRVVMYVTADELARIRQEAARRRISLSRYAKERLTPSIQDEDDRGGAAERLAGSMRKTLTERTDGLADYLRTLIVMLDQLVRSTLTHLPEISEAQKERVLVSGERRYRDWQQEVEGLLRRMRAQAAAERQSATGNGAHV
jgi:hypothetical protein